MSDACSKAIILHTGNRTETVSACFLLSFWIVVIEIRVVEKRFSGGDVSKMLSAAAIIDSSPYRPMTGIINVCQTRQVHTVP